LKKHKGLGLSTNQLGITDVRACIIKGENELVLINPKITQVSEDSVIYIESCLSIPKTMRKPIKTLRYKSVVVETDNLGTIEFFPTNEKSDWRDANEFFSDEGMMECVTVQHEIDHLNGILITDKIRRYSSTITASKKYGRNERVMVKLPGGDTEFMKYKQAIPLLEMGAEII
jgi:peptide deformylase